MAFNVKKLEDRYFSSGPSRELTAQDDFAQFVERRFYSMSHSRNTWYQRTQKVNVLWDVYKDWLLDGENFEKAVRFPTLRDVGQALIDEILKSPPQATLEAENGENPHRAQALEFILEDILDSPDEKVVQRDCLNDMIYTGEGYRLINYYDIERQDGDKTVTLFNNVGSERIDPVQVYLDESGRYLWNPKRKNIKRDAIIKFKMPRTTFIDEFQEREGVINLDTIGTNEKPLSGDMTTPTTEETNERGFQNREVIGYIYYNQEEQIYGVVANRVTVIPPRTIQNKHYRIPLVNYKFQKRNDDTFYGISLAELIAPHIYAQDTLFNLELMGQKLRLMSPMIMDSDLGYNRKIHKMHPKAVWKLNVPPGRNLQQSIFPVQFAQNDSNGFYNMNNYIESMFTITSGIDRRSLFLSPGELATQTALKNQSMQKRVNSLVYSNEIEAEAQLVELMVSDIKQYLPQKVKMIKDGTEMKRHRKVKVEGYVVKQNADGDARFEPSQGNDSYFAVTPESVDVSVRVKVRSVRQKVALQEMKTARLLQFLPIVSNITSVLAQTNPEMLGKIDFAGIIEQLAESLDMDLSKTLKDESTASFDNINREHMAMNMGLEVPVPPEETFEQSLQHKKQHEQLRFVFRNGKITNEETQIWKGMSKIAKRRWQEHYIATLENIKNKVLSELSERKEPQMPQAMPQPTQVKGPAPVKESSVEAKVAKQTLLK